MVFLAARKKKGRRVPARALVEEGGPARRPPTPSNLGDFHDLARKKMPPAVDRGASSHGAQQAAPRGSGGTLAR
jgi:hypothetical protein